MAGSVSLKMIAAVIGLTLLSEAISVQSCPSSCLCYVDKGGLRTANCSGVNFINENKYNKVFHEIDVLNLRMNNDDAPVKLWDEMFVPFAKLKILNLDDCRISYLPKNVFKGLKKIYEINLASNEIKHFENAVFENVYTLNKLNLKGNQLQGSSKPFISSSSLRELDLSYCGIASLQNEFFHGVKKLTRLYLDGNHLQTVKEHILPRGITHLNLANNRIVNVPVSAIYSLNQLRWLDLGANPVNCTCSLINLQDNLSSRAIIMAGEDLRCAYPPELENVKLSKVNENEACYKEVFTTRYHFKKSQASKYPSYHKKDYYFENEKYNPFELQGDDPGTSTDDYAEDNENEYNYDKAVTTVGTVLVDHNKDEKPESGAEHADKANTEPQNLVDSEDDIKETQHNNEEGTKDATHENLLTSHDSKLEDTNNDQVVNNEGNEDVKAQVAENQTANTDNAIKGNSNDTDNENNDTDPTQPPFVVEEGDDEHGKGKSHAEVFDDNMKDDEVMPVNILPQNELFNSSEKLEINTSTTEISPLNIVDVDETPKNNYDEEDNEEYDEGVKKVESDLKNYTTELKASTDGTIESDDHSKQDNKLHEGLSGIIDPNEVEGSGVGSEENITTNVSSIPIFHEGIHEITEEPVHKTEIHNVETHSKISAKSPSDDNESVGHIVDKKPINYEEMGPHIVVGCIIVFIVVLIFVSLYKGLCKSKAANRKPLSDVEANNGTELQDITSSLLAKTPINDEKHNNKYPNEVPSSETINLIKPDKIDEPTEANEQNDSHDLNQNDSKNDVIVRNGKTHDGSPPPIEKTKAKLTVLLESIPRTPIFVQKRPTTLNNGVS